MLLTKNWPALERIGFDYPRAPLVACGWVNAHPEPLMAAHGPRGQRPSARAAAAQDSSMLPAMKLPW